MADTAVNNAGGDVLYLSKNVRTDISGAGQAVTTGNTAVLTPIAPSSGPSVAGRPFHGRYMLIRMVPGAASTVTFKAGVTGGTPANLAASGDLILSSFTADSVIQIELARFLQADGTVRAEVGGTGPVTFSVLNLSKAC